MAKIGRPVLSSAKRQQVWEMWNAGESLSVIAQAVGSPAGSIFSILLPFGGIYQAPQRRRIGRPASTISREVARNRGVVKYRAMEAGDRVRGCGLLAHVHDGNLGGAVRYYDEFRLPLHDGPRQYTGIELGEPPDVLRVDDGEHC